jgi:hypothetical protein
MTAVDASLRRGAADTARTKMDDHDPLPDNFGRDPTLQKSTLSVAA